MGGHGGLNILPQKRWNVYNYENREKVRKDEEAAAKEEQLKREQSRKRDAEFRLEQLRTARGLVPVAEVAKPLESDLKSGHINLFEGIKIFDPVKGSANEGVEDGPKKKKKREEVEKKVISAEDEKYRLGYGVAGKGVKLPWYLERHSQDVDAESNENDCIPRAMNGEAKRGGKKTLEELRAERLNREKKEKEREQALVVERSRERNWKNPMAYTDRDASRRWQSRR